MADIYFWRQFFILFAGLLYSFCVGIMLGFPSVLGPAISSPNSTDIRTTTDHASWIATINGVGGLIGSFILSPVMQIFGRKASHCTINTFLLVGWIIFYFAKDITALYSARFIQGFSVGGIYMNSIIISEYVHPARRGYFITLKKVSIGLGTLCCHALSAFWTWRQVAIFSAIFPLMAIIWTLFWPESPSYLALKGRFSQCEKSFKWLNGNSEESWRQLKSLIKSQREKIEGPKRNSKGLMKIWKQLAKKDFQKALWISSLLTSALDLCGRYYFAAYTIQIMTEILNNKTSAIYFTIGIDSFTLIALSLSTIVVSFIKRRTILFSSGIFAMLLMLLISVMAYLKTVYTLSKYVLWLTALIIILQCFIVNLGLIPVSFAIIGEIFPLEHKGMGACVSGVVFTSFYALTLKITPVLMEYTGLHGTYAIFGVALAISLMLLYKIVPETKDKTLQAIEDELNGVENKELVPMEEGKLMH